MKFAKGYEKNIPFVVLPKPPKVWKKFLENGQGSFILTLVLRGIFPKHIFCRGLQIIMEGHITLNLLPVYSSGCPLSIDAKISTIH